MVQPTDNSPEGARYAKDGCSPSITALKGRNILRMGTAHRGAAQRTLKGRHPLTMGAAHRGAAQRALKGRNLGSMGAAHRGAAQRTLKSAIYYRWVQPTRPYPLHAFKKDSLDETNGRIKIVFI